MPGGFRPKLESGVEAWAEMTIDADADLEKESVDALPWVVVGT